MWNVIIGCSLILLGFITFGFFRAKSEKLHKQNIKSLCNLYIEFSCQYVIIVLSKEGGQKPMLEKYTLYEMLPSERDYDYEKIIYICVVGVYFWQCRYCSKCK